MEPASTATIIVPLAITCSPAAIAFAMGEVIAFGIAGLFMYSAHKKMQKNKKKIDECFPLDDRFSEQKAGGCYSSEVSVIDPIIGCGIVENQIKVTEAMPYEKPEEMNDVCAFPRAEIEQPILCASAIENDYEENKQYPGP